MSRQKGHGYWTLLRDLVHSLRHWESFYFRYGTHPAISYAVITYPFLIVGKIHASGLFFVSANFKHSIYHFSLFLPVIRLNFLFPNLYTLIYCLLFLTRDFIFVSVGPSRGVTLCHVMLPSFPTSHSSFSLRPLHDQAFIYLSFFIFFL